LFGCKLRHFGICAAKSGLEVYWPTMFWLRLWWLQEIMRDGAMLTLFSKFLQRDGAAVTSRVADGVRIYAIGDIHGRLDLLEQLLARIEQDQSANRTAHAVQLIFLGDYVDRGMQSAEVIERLMLLQSAPATIAMLAPVFLRGNHEDVLLRVAQGAADEDMLGGWLGYGGRETLASYGVSSRLLYGDDLDAITTVAAQVVPDSHRQFMASLSMRHESGDYLFVHAGVHPGRALDDQRDHDLLWIREPFLSSRTDFGKIVVHGHSISMDVQIKPNRIGIDTGAYATNRLTALVLEGNTRRLLATA
jgi:serine/threonine protein phosphatase 1